MSAQETFNNGLPASTHVQKTQQRNDEIYQAFEAIKQKHRADMGEKAKGLPMWTIFVALALLGYGLHLVTSGSLWTKVISGSPSVPTPALASGHSPAPISLVPTNTNVLPAATVIQKATEVPIKLRSVTFTGLANGGSGLVAYFREGTNNTSYALSRERSFRGLVRDGGKVTGIKIGASIWNVGETKEIPEKKSLTLATK